MKKKIGLALGSGGFRGLAHIGVIKALVARGVEIDMIAGTSAGAIVGGLYAVMGDIELVEELVLSGRKDVFKALVDPSIKGGLVKGNRLRSMLEKWYGDKNFDDLQIRLSTVAADLISGEACVLNQGSLVDAVQASMSVPGMFRPVEIDGKCLVDGGVINPVPDDVLLDMGADVTIAVNLDKHKLKLTDSKGFKSIQKAGLRSIYIVCHYLALHSINHADICLAPEVVTNSVVGLEEYFLKKGMAEEMIKSGEKAVEENWDRIEVLIGA